MSDTPETDEEFARLGKCRHPVCGELVAADFARKLERERNLLREEMARLKGHAKRYRMRAEELEKERDEWSSMAGEYLAQRDEARLIAETLDAWGDDAEGVPPLPWHR